MQGKTNLQQEFGKTGHKPKQVQNGLQRWKEHRSTSEYKTWRQTQPRTRRNWIARSWEETLKHRLTPPASYTHKHSEVFFSGQSQGTRTQASLAVGYSSFLQALCYTACILISKLNTSSVHKRCPLITLPGKRLPDSRSFYFSIYSSTFLSISLLLTLPYSF